MSNFLPEDEELVRREGELLKLFDKFSVDEGSDPELADFNSDETVEDDSGSGSSFSEASSIESASDSSSVIENLKDEIRPVVEDRISASPAKGINLQIKSVDPSVTVDEWLKANNEFTTTTKKYKKTGVNENNKTIITTTKQTKTTTKRSSFQSFVPRFLKNALDTTNGIRAIEDIVTSKPKGNDKSAETGTKTKLKQHKSKEKKSEKPKKHKHTEAAATFKVPSSNNYSLRNAKRNNRNGVDTTEIVQQRTEPKKNHTKQSNVNVQKKSEKLKTMELDLKERNFDYPVLPINDSSKRFLRSSNKDSKIKGNAAITKHSTIDKTQKKQERPKPIKLNSEKVSSSTIGINNTEMTKSITNPQRNKIQTKLSKRTNHTKHVVIHSPNSDTILGTKIDETFMRVTKYDYEKHIHPKDLQNTNKSIINDSIIPINRRIVYQPPATIIEENSNSDSEDVLVTSYRNTGRIWQIGV